MMTFIGIALQRDEHLNDRCASNDGYPAAALMYINIVLVYVAHRFGKGEAQPDTIYRCTVRRIWTETDSFDKSCNSFELHSVFVYTFVYVVCTHMQAVYVFDTLPYIYIYIYSAFQ